MSEIQPALAPHDWAEPHRPDGASHPEGSMIKPAIAPEHWPERLAEVERFGFAEMWQDMHDAAALALHGQPFGFTWEDVDLLRSVADHYATFSPLQAEALELRDVAARIAALLPPR